MRGASGFLQNHPFQLAKIETQKLARREIFGDQQRWLGEGAGDVLAQIRPGNMQKLLANVADVADSLAQIFTAGGGEFFADLLHIDDDRRRQPQLTFPHQTADVAGKLIILN